MRRSNSRSSFTFHLNLCFNIWFVHNFTYLLLKKSPHEEGKAVALATPVMEGKEDHG
ncbi:hypothetical protein CSB69_2821 [Morganella morganii]|nr:hypothetical protein CSB69_2821 [Morganella morganii]